jgi:hypothetical protein
MKRFVLLFQAYLFIFTTQSFANGDFSNYYSNQQYEQNTRQSCITRFVGPAASEKTSCTYFVELIGTDHNQFLSSHLSSVQLDYVPAVNLCCDQAKERAISKCKTAYNQSRVAASCVPKYCNCYQFIIKDK